MIWVAEIGSNHKGIPALAHEMIRKAAWAGATVAKFQLGHDPKDPIRYIDDFAPDLKRWCDHYNITFGASIWSYEGIRVAEDVGLRWWKVAYQQYKDNKWVDRILEEPGDHFISGRNIYVQSEYPTYPQDFILPSSFTDWYGYSSHVPGYADALIAVARGAKYIEKHVTLDKTEESIRDNHFALDFDEFRDMVDIGKEIARLV